MIKDLIVKTRSYRRFRQEESVSRETLLELVDLARLSGSAANLQPLKFIISSDPARNAIIFPTLAWAGYLKDWHGPAEGERPSAYIIILGDTTISRSFGCDHGIAAQSILLGATEKGLGGCTIGSIDREALRTALDIPVHLEMLIVLAMGRPVEQIVLEDVQEDGCVKYYRDDNRVHHVPKRRLEDIVIG